MIKKESEKKERSEKERKKERRQNSRNDCDIDKEEEVNWRKMRENHKKVEKGLKRSKRTEEKVKE